MLNQPPNYLKNKSNLFIIYDERDFLYFDELKKHLHTAKDDFYISDNHGAKGGDDVAAYISSKINKSSIIIFLVSKNFISNSDCYLLVGKAFLDTNTVQRKAVFSIITNPCHIDSRYERTIKYPQKTFLSNEQPSLSDKEHTRDGEWASLVNKLKAIINVRRGDLAQSKKDFDWAIIYYEYAQKFESDKSITKKISDCRLKKEIEEERKRIRAEINAEFVSKYKKEADLTREVSVLQSNITSLSKNESLLQKIILGISIGLLISTVFSVCTCNKYNKSKEAKLTNEYSQIAKIQPISLVSIKLFNKKNGKRKEISDEIKNKNLRYLCVDVILNKYSKGESQANLYLKIFDSSGGLITANDSPEGFTSKTTEEITQGISSPIALICIGQDEPSYEQGTYRIEVFQQHKDVFHPLGFKFLTIK